MLDPNTEYYVEVGYGLPAYGGNFGYNPNAKRTSHYQGGGYYRLPGMYKPQDAFAAYSAINEGDYEQVFLLDFQGQPVAVLDVHPEDAFTSEGYEIPEGYIRWTTHGFNFDPQWGWLPYEHLKEERPGYTPNTAWGYAA